MLRRRRIPTARLQRTIQQDIWAHSFWALLRERFLPMAVAIGGHHIVMVATTIPIRGHTVAPIMGATVIIIQRLIMTPPRELTDGNRLLMGRTDRRRGVPVTILTLERMHGVLQFRHLMGVEAQHRHIILTPAPMLRPDRVPARTPSGVVPTCREETRALPCRCIPEYPDRSGTCRCRSLLLCRSLLKVSCFSNAKNQRYGLTGV